MIKVQTNTYKDIDIDIIKVRKTVKKIFELLGQDKNIKIDLNFVSSQMIKELNRRFRKKNQPTTILTFVASDVKNFIEKPSRFEYLGEIFICLEEIKKRNLKAKISTKEGVTEVLVHGILHLLGYTHKKEKDSLLMEQKEKEILSAL